MAYQKLQASTALEVIPSDSINIPNPAVLSVSSTTTSAAALKLIDSSGDFINKRINIGDIVYAGNVAATVTAVDSATQLSVTVAVPTTTSYKIFRKQNANLGCVLYVGAAGNIKVTTAGGDVVTFNGVLAGSFMPVQVLKVWATGSPTNIVALW
jgi:hypothetical protein